MLYQGGKMNKKGDYKVRKNTIDELYFQNYTEE